MSDPLAGLRNLAKKYKEVPVVIPLKCFDKYSSMELIELAEDFLINEMPEVIAAFRVRVDLRIRSKDASKSNCYMIEAYRKTIIQALLRVQIKQDVAELQARYPNTFWRE